MKCLFCNSEKKTTANFCSECGKDWKNFESGIDNISSLQKYNLFCKDLVANSSDLSLLGNNDAIRERLKISFGASEKILTKITQKYKEARHLCQFSMELIYDSNQSFATHDTYLKFKLTNKSTSESYRVSIAWDDAESEANGGYHASSRSIIRPGDVGIFGGTHVFSRAGTKEIAGMRLVITNILDEEALFLIEPFQLKIGSADTKIFNTINTTTQISVTGRNVVDASGIASSISGLPQSSDAEISLPLRAIFAPLNDSSESEYAFLKELASEQLVDGNEYQGEWINGKYGGHGELNFSDKRRYVGNFLDGEMSGSGTLVYPDGSSYVGNFLRGEYFGSGRLTLSNGTSYEGDFNGGPYPVSGVVTYLDGSSYQGGFLDDKFHGEGQFKDSNGVITSGSWDRGRLAFPKKFLTFHDAVKGLKLSNVFGSNQFRELTSPTTLGLGLDSDSNCFIRDLNELGNICIISGVSQQGDSSSVSEVENFLQLCVLNAVFKAKPEQVRLLLIDCSPSGGLSIFQRFEKTGHLLCPPISDVVKAANACNWILNEGSRRKKLFTKFGADSLNVFNDKCLEAEKRGLPFSNPFSLRPENPERLFEVPSIYVLINGLDDLIFVNSGVSECIRSISEQFSRFGLHLICSIKPNSSLQSHFLSKIIFRSEFPVSMPSSIPSDWPSQLIGNGDAFFFEEKFNNYSYLQTPTINTDEINRVADWIRGKYDCHYVVDVFVGENFESNNGEPDPLYEEAVRIVMTNNSPSISLVQRTLRIGYNRSARLLEDMERSGLISNMSSDGKRSILRRN